jgi:hypothetical protein
VALSDRELLNFDTDELAHWDDEEAERNLTQHPEVFRSHLLIARWLDDWAANLGRGDAEFAQALREVGAHLRQGDLLPGGAIHQEVAGD